MNDVISFIFGSSILVLLVISSGVCHLPSLSTSRTLSMLWFVMTLSSVEGS